MFRLVKISSSQGNISFMAFDVAFWIIVSTRHSWKKVELIRCQWSVATSVDDLGESPGWPAQSENGMRRWTSSLKCSLRLTRKVLSYSSIYLSFLPSSLSPCFSLSWDLTRTGLSIYPYAALHSIAQDLVPYNPEMVCTRKDNYPMQ